MAKKPYELSIWEDVPSIKNDIHYFSEIKKATIGSDNFESPLGAFDVTVKDKINGEVDLTFSMFYKYVNENGILVDNPLFLLLSAEQKIKLRDGEAYKFSSLEELEEEDDKRIWQDFLIKNIDKDSSNYKATIIAKQLHTNELGKNGWNIVLNTDLENNYGTINQLAEYVLADTDWKVATDSYSPTERIKETLFEVKLDRNIIATNVLTKKKITIKANDLIYVFYSYINHNDSKDSDVESVWELSNKTCQFIYTGSKIIPEQCDNNRLFIDEELKYNYEGTIQSIIGVPIIQSFFGNRIEKTVSTHYESVGDRYVTDYKLSEIGKQSIVNIGDSDIYGYIERDYAVSKTSQNYITNSSNFVSYNSWSGVDDISMPELVLYSPGITDYVNSNNNYDSIRNCLSFDFSKGAFLNKGPTNAHLEVTKEEEFIVRFKGRWVLNNNIQKIDFNLTFELKDEKESFGSVKANYFSTNIGNDGYLKSPSKRPTFSKNKALIDEEGYGYILFKASKSSKKDENALKFYISSTTTKANFYLEDIQFFKYFSSKSFNPIFPTDIPEAVINETKKYYYIKDKKIINLPSKPEYYIEKNLDNYQSVRSIEVKESNYFNILQTLAEKFEVWVDFEIKHTKDGKILLDSNNNPQKFVRFSKYSPTDKFNYAGFKNGINLKGIKRQVDSNALASKVIVKNNNQEYAVDGSCSIARARSNPSGETEIYNFDYYVDQELLDYTQLLKDLYGTLINDFRYIPKLKKFNNDYFNLTNEQSGLKIVIAEKESALTLFKSYYSAAETEILKLLNDISGLDSTDSLYKSKNKAIGYARAQKVQYQKAIDLIEKAIKHYKNRDSEIEKQIENILKNKKELKSEFYKKYSRFIQEGIWTDENYIDDELYYLDAQKISYISAYPQVSYIINVIDLEGTEEFDLYSFNIGDRTFVEDPEFFGYNLISTNDFGGIKTPKKIEVIISERSRVLDNPSKTTLTVRNYKNQFEELFQKITATTQALQYKSGEYGRAASVITSNREIDADTLEKSFANNSLTLATSYNNSVIFDTGTGIEVIDNENTNQRVRIVGGGIYLSNDGGSSWTTGIYGGGINTSLLVAGQIDVSKINLVVGGIPYFRWDQDGIRAFKVTSADDRNKTYSFGHYVNFNQYGLYATGEDGDSKINNAIKKAKNNYNEIIDAINKTAAVAITYKGITLNGPNEKGLSISAEAGLEVFNGSWFDDFYINKVYSINPFGNQYQPGDKIPIISIGKFYDNDPALPKYGLRIRNNNGEIVVSTDTSGQLWIRNDFYIGSIEEEIPKAGLSGKNFEILPSYIKNFIEQGLLKEEDCNSVRLWINGDKDKEEPNFYVLDNGFTCLRNSYIYANGGHFNGTINAESGIFSGDILLGNGVNGFSGREEADYVFWTGYNSETETRKVAITKEGKLILNDFEINNGSINQIYIPDGRAGFVNEFGINPVLFWVNAPKSNGEYIKEDSSFYITKDGEVSASKLYLKDSIFIHREEDKEYYQNGINDKDNKLTIWAGANDTGSLNSKFTVDYEGNVKATSLNLGDGILSAGGATIEGSLKLGAVEGLILSSEVGISTANYNDSRGWKIDKEGNAFFNNISARGELTSTTFTYNSQNFMGGDLVVAPTFYDQGTNTKIIPSSDISNLVFEISLINSDFSEDSFWEQVENESKVVFGAIIENSASEEKEIKELTNLIGKISKEENKFIITVPAPADSIDGKYNSGWNVLPGTSIALQNGCGIKLSAGKGSGPAVIITDVEEEQKIITQLGNLNEISDEFFGELTGYGLYTQNAYLTGKLYLPNAGITNDINTIEEEVTDEEKEKLEGQSIRIWAGTVPDEKNKAPFRVTHDGSLYASKGVFSGKVEAVDSTFSGWLNTTGILVDDEEDEDEIKHMFYVAYDKRKNNENFIPSVDDKIIQIDKKGLSIWEGGLSIFSDYAAGWRENGEYKFYQKTNDIVKQEGKSYFTIIDKEFKDFKEDNFSTDYFITKDTNFDSRKTYYEIKKGYYLESKDGKFLPGKIYYKIIGNNYIIVDTSEAYEEGLVYYEYFSPTYIKTEDTIFVLGKIYYEIPVYYELVESDLYYGKTEDCYPYIKAIDKQDFRIYTSNLHSGRFYQTDEENSEISSVKIKNGQISFGRYKDLTGNFEIDEEKAFNSKDNWIIFSHEEENKNKLKIITEDIRNSSNPFGKIELIDNFEDDKGLELSIEGILNVDKEIILSQKLTYPGGIIQNYVGDVDWDKGIDFII